MPIVTSQYLQNVPKIIFIYRYQHDLRILVEIGSKILTWAPTWEVISILGLSQ